MDWSRIKTIFIMTFLVLDIYLLYQFLTIRSASQYELATEASFEEKLKADGISYTTMPLPAAKEQYLSARPRVFGADDLKKLTGQKAKVKDKTVLKSDLDTPLQLSTRFNPADLAVFINENILFGTEYQYWQRNEKKNTITYFQQYEKKEFYQNFNGTLTFYTNGENQIISYEQTYLEGIEKLTAKEEVLSPMKAVEVIYQKGLLKPKSKITKAELGYSSIIQLAASQVFVPTWRFVIDDEESLYVNAFEGQFIQLNSEENKVVE